MCDSANSMGWNKVEGGSGLLLVAAKGLEQVVRLSQFGFGLNLLLSQSASLLVPCWLFLLSRCSGGALMMNQNLSLPQTASTPRHRLLRFLPPRKLTLRSP
jgi:hypothetical protein